MFQIETVDDCSCILRSVIEDAPPAPFPYSCNTHTKETKNVHVNYSLFVYWDKRSKHGSDFVCGEEFVWQTISLENGEPEVKLERVARKEVVSEFQCLVGRVCTAERRPRWDSKHAVKQ